ncbi:MAG: 4Fe-4S binding protein, partial [Acetatifactor sp.]
RCGECVKNCPHGAISMGFAKTTTQNVMEERK